MTALPDRIASLVTTYSKTVIAVMLVLTVAMGVGATMVEQETDLEQFETDSPAVNASEYIQANFETEDTGNETTVQLVTRGENVLTQEQMVSSLEFQQTVRENERVNATLFPDPFVSVANILATTQVRQDDPEATDPSLETQIEALRGLSEEEYEALLESVLGPEGNEQALALMPSGYEPESLTAEAHLTVITQQQGGGVVAGTEQFVSTTDAQLELRDLANAHDQEFSVFGAGIVGHEIDQSLGDSLAIVGPLALLFVIIALVVAYRDLLDIVLGVVGIGGVLVWTFGFMGWAGVAFNQLLIAVPVLLIGLSIDYAIHVFMRHREHRLGVAGPSEGAVADGGRGADSGPVRGSMTLALGGVGVALVWVTATAALGFLSNLTSPIGPLRDFGVTSAFGIVAALCLFGALIPALKVELDELLESWGLDRQKRAFGTGGTRFSGLLSVGATAARRAPLVVIVLALALTLVGVWGATQVDTNFEQEDFLADSPPAWTQSLPEAMRPGTYQVKDDLQFVQANFQQGGTEAELLIRGDVDDDSAPEWIADATDRATELDSVFLFANGEADVESPLTAMERARADDSFDRAFREADTNDDGVPDSNVGELYGDLLTADPGARTVLFRNDAGEYEAVRMTIGVRGDATTTEITGDMRTLAESIEDESDGQLTVVATGDPVITNAIESDLLDTVLESLLITLVSVFLFLAAAYYLVGNGAVLGVVTLLPVAFSVTWILGTMYLIGMPFNALTGTIAALTIGLGIAYCIHISSRYMLELERQENVWTALETTVTGTGGALLGSAATTVGGFGTLVLAILPVLEQFGTITGLTIIYAFLASVLVLPSLLVLWTRYLGPDGYFPAK